MQQTLQVDDTIGQSLHHEKPLRENIEEVLDQFADNQINFSSIAARKKLASQLEERMLEFVLNANSEDYPGGIGAGF